MSSQAGLAPGAGLPSCRVCGGGFLPLVSRPFSLQLLKGPAVSHHKEKMSKVKQFWCGWLREKRLAQSFIAGPEITHSSLCGLSDSAVFERDGPRPLPLALLRFLAAPCVRKGKAQCSGKGQQLSSGLCTQRGFLFLP